MGKITAHGDRATGAFGWLERLHGTVAFESGPRDGKICRGGGKVVGTSAQGTRGTEAAVGKLLSEGHVNTRIGLGALRPGGARRWAGGQQGVTGGSRAASTLRGRRVRTFQPTPSRPAAEGTGNLVIPILSLFKILIFCSLFFAWILIFKNTVLRYHLF